ncbi:condensation domain-containing protein, partial [Streptomyces sp. NPDC005009]
KGLALRARDVFEGATVAGIAARARTLEETDAPAVGDAPLTPVMRDLLRRAGAAADGFCQWVEVSVPAGGEEEHWLRTLDAVLERHDVLRAHLAGDLLRVPPSGAVTAAEVLLRVPVAEDLPAGELRALIEARIADVRAGMTPATGPLLRALWVDAGPSAPGRLVLIAHHLLVDGVSWRILLDDLRHAHEGGTPARHGLPFLAWARSLREADRQSELPHWRRMTSTPALAARSLDPARDTVATAFHHEILLDTDTTRALVTTLPAVLRTTADAGLLSALARAVRAWRGTPRVLVALESHGRPGHADLSQTVGWFTAVHPVLLDAGEDPAAVAERLRAQGDGLGHGILTTAGLLDPVEPQIAWNYLGRYAGAPSEPTPWQAPPDADPLGSGGTDDLPLPYLLTVNALVREDRLGIRLTWPGELFTAAEAEELAGHLHTALRDTAAAAREFVSLADGRAVAEVQPLSPLQSVMLRHSRTEHPDPYTVQSCFSLSGVLDADALREAGADLLARHPNLGAVFPGESGLVPKSAHLDFRVSDGPAEEVLAADLAEAFDLGAGPLVRLTVIRHHAERSDLVLTTHHVLSDGWSAPRILTELFALYTARVRGEKAGLPEPVPFSRYLDWRAANQPDLTAWAEELADLPEADHFGTGEPGPAWQEPAVVTADARLVTELHRIAAERGLTPNTLVQGAWSVLLARHAGRADVCFGAMVACRPPELEGVEEIIGLLANTVPVRARLTGTLAGSLTALQNRQRALLEQQHVALPELERLTGRRRLFDSVVVFENYPVDRDRLREPAPGLTLVGTRFREATHHPVTLTVMPEGDGWTCVLGHRAGVDAEALAEEFLALLRSLGDHLDRDVSTLLEGP